MKIHPTTLIASLALSVLLGLARLGSPEAFLGGMDLALGTTAFHHPAVGSDGQILQIGGGGGGRIPGSDWIIGGRGASGSLINTTKASELDLQYGGLMAICLFPAQPFQLGLEVFLGGGSYSLFAQAGPGYSKHADSFFLAEPRLHAYYAPFGKLILDVHVGYALTTAAEHPLDGLAVGFGILFGTLD